MNPVHPKAECNRASEPCTIIQTRIIRNKIRNIAMWQVCWMYWLGQVSYCLSHIVYIFLSDNSRLNFPQ